MKRGAELYDLFMLVRYDREKAAERNLWTLACELARQFREEDERERGGRRSWLRLKVVMERSVRLIAHVSNVGRRK